MGGKAANERHENWLLIKERDDEALPQSGDAVVADNPLSVASGRSLDAIAADRDWVWHSNRDDNEKPALQTVAPEKIPGARQRRIPEGQKPQLATVANKAPEGSEWLHEIKYDGYRLLARIAEGAARLITRGGLDWTAKFPVLARRLGELPLELGADRRRARSFGDGRHRRALRDCRMRSPAGRRTRLTFSPSTCSTAMVGT